MPVSVGYAGGRTALPGSGAATGAAPWLGAGATRKKRSAFGGRFGERGVLDILKGGIGEMRNPGSGRGNPFDPNDPYGFLTETDAPTWAGTRNRLLGQAMKEGLFSFGANNPLVRGAGMRARRAGEGLKARSRTMAGLFGLDPAQFGNAALRADLSGQGRVADAEAEAQGEQEQSLADMYRQLYGQAVSGDMTTDLERYRSAEARKQQKEGKKKDALDWATGIGGLVF